jgi:hypothetical protein
VKPQGFIPPAASPSAHEGADLHIGNVVRVASWTGVILVVSILLLALFFHGMEQKYPGRTSEAAPTVTPSELPPLPRVQNNPLRDLEEVRRVEDSHLDQYGWIDRPHGVAQIPVERAMVLWVKNYAATPPPSAAPTRPMSPAPAVAPAASAPPGPAAGPATNAVPTPATTELQMRQEKAQESTHEP